MWGFRWPKSTKSVFQDLDYEWHPSQDLSSPHKEIG